MPEFEILNIIREIKSGTGIDITEKCRKREVHYTRVVFFKMVRDKKPQIPLAKLGKMVGLHHTSLVYALQSYENLRNYPDFMEIEQRIKAIIDKKYAHMGIYCNTIPYLHE